MASIDFPKPMGPDPRREIVRKKALSGDVITGTRGHLGDQVVVLRRAVFEVDPGLDVRCRRAEQIRGGLRQKQGNLTRPGPVENGLDPRNGLPRLEAAVPAGEQHAQRRAHQAGVQELRDQLFLQVPCGIAGAGKVRPHVHEAVQRD
jgi:hypothetical protein